MGFHDDAGSPDEESVESLDLKDETSVFKILKETKESKPCDPDEIFDCMKTYFTILKVAGVYFENPKEMEKIKMRRKERLEMNARKGYRRGDKNLMSEMKVNYSATDEAEVMFHDGIDENKPKRAMFQLIFSKLHRVYCTILLIFHWSNSLRLLTMFTPNDSFGPQLLFKIAGIIFILLSTGIVTSFYWACANGKFATVIVGLSGLRGVDRNFLSKLNGTTCWSCGCTVGLNLCLIIFGYFKLEWMYKPFAAPVNTWIITENQVTQLVSRVLILLMLFISPMASFFTTTVGMVLSVIIRRSLIFVKQDLKSSMVVIESVGRKKRILTGSETVTTCNKGKAVFDIKDNQKWKISYPVKINPLYSNHAVMNQKSFWPEDRQVVIADKLNFEHLRQRFQFISKIIKKADKFLCVSNACGIGGYLAEIILLLITILWYYCKYTNSWPYLATLVFWLLVSISSLSYLSLSAVLVNNAAQRVLEKLHDIDLSQYSLEVLNLFSIFLSRMSTDNIGFSVLHLFVINRDTLMTLAGLFLTYFLLLYQLNPDSDGICDAPTVSNDTHTR